MSRRAVVLGAGVAGAVVGAAGWAAQRAVGSPSSPVGFTLSPDQLAEAVAFLAAHPAVDAHAHPGRTFVRDAHDLTWKMRLYAARGTFEDRTVADMRRGGLAAAVFSGVSDFPTLDARGGTLVPVRPFAAGEAHAYYRAQIRRLTELVDRAGLDLVTAPADVERATGRGRIGAILGVEGADFLEDDLGRVGQCRADGIRVLTLVHYAGGGPVGDAMTVAPVHGGLTAFGRDVVRELNAAGIVVDLSHASHDTVSDALAVTSRPLALTHTDLERAGRSNARFVPVDLAREVAATGGVVGAWPAGMTMRTLRDFADRILELVEVLGEEHVCIGTDMDANYKPVLETYTKLPLLVGELLRRGMPEAALAKVLGGNVLRVLDGCHVDGR